MTDQIDRISLLTSSRFIDQKEYWTHKLSGEIKQTALLIKAENHGASTADIKTLAFDIPAEVTRRLMKVTKGNELSTYIIFLTALKVLIFRYASNEDVTVVSPLYEKRITADTHNDRVFIRDQVTGGITFKELLMVIRRSTIAAYDNQDYPSQKLLEYVFESRSSEWSTRMSGIACSLDSIHAPLPKIEENGMILFHFYMKEGKSTAHIRYDKMLYQDTLVNQVSKHFNRILEHALMNIDVKIHDIPVLQEAEKERILFEFNGIHPQENRPAIVPEAQSLHLMLQRQAVKTPDHVAVVFQDKQLSYRQLNIRANRLAEYLRSKGVGAESPVGIMIKPSPEAIIGLLGIMKAGGAYVPIDPDYPDPRISFMLKDSGLKTLLTEPEWINRAPFEGEAIALSEDIQFPGNGENPVNINNTQDIVYIIYTSGTTGKPKGVIVSHQNVVLYVKTFLTEFPLTHRDIVLQQASYSFDTFVEEVYPVMLKGGKVAVIPRQDVADIDLLSRFMNRHCVTMVSCSPLLLNELNKIPVPRGVHTLLSGGDVLKCEHMDKLILSAKVYNTYGPTETTVCAAYHRCLDITEKNVPVGKPISNYSVFILDPAGGIQPPGAAGELYISGAGVARGYLNRQELTHEKFVPNPFIEGDIFYKSGDLASWLPDGSINFHGRIDNQIKLRGYRIELGEIEERLMQFPLVKEAAAVVKTDADGDKYICAYILPEPGETGQQPDIDDLRKHLSGELPYYMIPSYFIIMETFPRTLSGKLNREALPLPEIKSTDKYVPPAGEVERKLVDIWSDVLLIEKEMISVEANFFELGGHSLKTTTLAARIHKTFNVKISLTQIFTNATIRAQSSYIKGAEENIYSAVEPAEKREYYSLSSAQKRLFVIQQMDLESTVYNMPQFIAFEQISSVEKLKQVFAKLIHRHESLRTSFHMIGHQPVQKIHHHVEFTLEIREDRVERGSLRSFIRPFDLATAPLMRAALIRTPDNHNLLFIDMHHIISDGTSNVILEQDFKALYADEPMPQLRLQYKDYSQWQTGQNESGRLKKQADFWHKEFQEEVPILDLPTDYPRPPAQNFDGDIVLFELSAADSGALKTLALQQGTGIFMVLLSALNVLLFKLSGQEDIVIGTPIAGRRHADLEKIIGMFVNTLALRNYPVGQKKFKEFLQEVKERTLDAFENQEYQFEDLVENAPLNRDVRRNPMFDVMLVLQNIDSPEIAIPGLTMMTQKFETHVAKFDLTLYAVEMEDKLKFSFEYCTKLFKKETIQRFIFFFKKIISSMLEDIGQHISGIDIISEDEKSKLLFEFNDTAADYPRDKTIHELFEEQARRTPHHTAVANAASKITYHELNNETHRLAGLLREKGVKPDSICAVMLKRSPEMIIAIIAILKAGGAYLPISPDYPETRTDFILKDGHVSLLVSADELAGQVNRKDIDIILFNSIEYTNASIPQSSGFSGSGPGHLAYVIYTSGSTGKPKGAMVEHRSLVNRLNWMQHYYAIGTEDVIMQKTPFTFDVSVWELLWWSFRGASVFLLKDGDEKNPERIMEAIERNGITTMHFVPSMLNAFLEYLEASKKEWPEASRLKQVFSSGEALMKYQADKFNRLVNKGNNIRLINLYGPTEATIDVSYFNCPRGEETEEDKNGKLSIPIGKPIDNIHLHIINKYMALQPIGIPGELCIGGDGLARGYLNRPLLTAEKFIHNPILPDKRLYRTGDLTRWLPDGNIEFLGRIDRQIKIRGFRVELEEIENQLIGHESIQEAVVKIKETAKGQNNAGNSGDHYIYAYFTSDEPLDISQLRSYLLKNLPQFMVPSYIVQIDRIPLTSNGKVDWKALDSYGVTGQPADEYAPPESELEKIIADTWKEVLGVDKVGIHDNFFDIGGHSLGLITVNNELKKTFNIDIPIADMFGYPTISALTTYMEQSREVGLSGTTNDRITKALEVMDEATDLLFADEVN